jgi:hypothetical protein
VAAGGALAAGAADGATTSSSYFPFASATHFELLASMSRPCLIARSEPGDKPSWAPMVAQALASRCQGLECRDRVPEFVNARACACARRACATSAREGPRVSRVDFGLSRVAQGVILAGIRTKTTPRVRQRVSHFGRTFFRPNINFVRRSAVRPHKDGR